MFHIFGKKIFLIDHLQKFVDIHNHILPGIDDGAKTNEDAIGLIKGFADFGVSNFIATPHIFHNLYPNTPETIFQSVDLLKNALLNAGLRDIYIAASAEHMIDDNFETILEKEEVMHMRNDYLLVEMSYLQPPLNFDAAIVKIVSKRYYPILAHPERYNFLHFKPKKYGQYKEQGILFQLNLLSLSDFYGKEVYRMGLKLLDDGLIDFAASDVHNLHQLNSLKELTISKKILKQLLPVINGTIETFY